MSTPSRKGLSIGAADPSGMIHHLVLFKLQPGLDEDRIEWMLRETRSKLLKIPEVLSVKCGRSIEEDAEWPFFLAVELESTEKLFAYSEHPVHGKFVQEVIQPFTAERLVLDFETIPGKDLRFS